MHRVLASVVFVAVAFVSAPAVAQAPYFSPKVTDVTVFKDGHALMMAGGRAKLQDGRCRTKDVPVPVLGTFWAIANGKDLQIDSVTAGTVDTSESRPCLTLDEIIQANVNKPATLLVQEKEPVAHQGVLLGILTSETTRDAPVTRAPAERYDSRGRYISDVAETTEQPTKQLASFVMLKTDKGVEMLKRESIMSVTVADPQTTTSDTKSVREISFHVSRDGKPADGEREIGIVYLQKGLRWIPEYRVELLPDGKARITLQGTVINEIADLDNVNLRLVVGVPSFIMKDTLSPLALRETPIRLSSYFAPPPTPGSRDPGYLYNYTMNQMAAPARGEGPVVAGPDIPAEGQLEDLFLYPKSNFSLKKGGRAIVQLLEVTAPFEDVYTWDISPLPPMELFGRLGQEQQQRLLASLTGAQAMHNVRFTNTGSAPWTTGPATIYKDQTPLAQQLMTYTSLKNSVDLPVTTATDLNTKKEEVEIRREPNALHMNGNDYTRVTLHGKLTVTNFKAAPVKISVIRRMIGTATAASAEGRITQVNALEDRALFGENAAWRANYDLGVLWLNANPLSKISWETAIPAGKSATLEYDWHYFVR